jgi:hypothetical protein
MSVKTVFYSPLWKTTQDTAIGPSPSIWYDCPLEDFAPYGQDPKLGYYFMDHFMNVEGLPATGTTTLGWGGDRNWAILPNAGSIIAQDLQQDGGVVGLACTTSGNTLQLGSLTKWLRMVSAATGNALTQGKVWFECRIALGSIGASVRDIFVGLSDDGVPSTNALTAVFSGADTVATGNSIIGFRFRNSATNPGDAGFIWNNSTAASVQAPTPLATLVNTVTGANPTAYAAGATGALASGFMKLGFVFDPTPGNPPDTVTTAVGVQVIGQLKKRLINVYVNGQQVPGYLTAADQVQVSTFPQTWMAPTISIRSGSATQLNSTLMIDWIRVAQAANAP